MFKDIFLVVSLITLLTCIFLPMIVQNLLLRITLISALL